MNEQEKKEFFDNIMPKLIAIGNYDQGIIDESLPPEPTLQEMIDEMNKKNNTNYKLERDSNDKK
jgi:hypothetical protein